MTWCYLPQCILYLCCKCNIHVTFQFCDDFSFWILFHLIKFNKKYISFYSLFLLVVVFSFTYPLGQMFRRWLLYYVSNSGKPPPWNVKDFLHCYFSSFYYLFIYLFFFLFILFYITSCIYFVMHCNHYSY